MQPKIHPFSNRSAVRIVEKRVDGENSQLVLALPLGASSRTERREPASARIRQAHQVLADLLLVDEMGYGGDLLLGAVAESLNEMLLELDQISGLQRLFELWVEDAP
jgi:hypothetical protein